MSLSYGIVKVIGGVHKGRIGYYDNDEGAATAVVYFGDPQHQPNFHKIRYRNLTQEITTDDLLQQLLALDKKLNGFVVMQSSTVKTPDIDRTRFDYMCELVLINSLLTERWLLARFHKSEGGKIFISHSSHDKTMARLLATDLVAQGYVPWFDEWDILAGESIPRAISDGLAKSSAAVVLLSRNSVQSRWVEAEWQAVYWDELVERKIKVIPLLIEECEIPTLLKTKKYADFTKGYSHGLEELLFSLGKFISENKAST